MDWIPLISSYPVWARVVLLICVLIGGGVWVLARKVEEPKQATSGPPARDNINLGNQQNAGTINNIFLGSSPPPLHPPGEATLIPKATPVQLDPRAIETLVEVVRKYKDEADKRGEHIELLAHIMMKWSQLQQSTMLRERSTGRPDPEANRAIDKEMQGTLAALLGNVEARATQQGNALIIRTGPNAFRVFNPVVMRITPNITFPVLPPGVTANISENSPVGFAVTFEPRSIPIETLPTAVMSAEI